jgi:hypothetical protein
MRRAVHSKSTKYIGPCNTNIYIPFRAIVIYYYNVFNNTIQLHYSFKEPC